MGEIVFWTIIRAVIVIPIVWIMKGYLDYQVWWMAGMLTLYGVIVHPAVLSYHRFSELNKDVVDGTLCTSCKYFDKGSVLCQKHDEHPTINYLPCEGLDWEPIQQDQDDENI